jgi:hypothetical protein
MTTTAQPTRHLALGAVGLVYLAAWIVGLLIWPVNLATNATGAIVLSTFTGHTVLASTQYLLTEGLAGLTLGIVLIAMARALPSRATLLAGGLAALVSLVETGIGLYLATALVPAHDAASAHTWFDLLNVLDGVKMLLLAITATVASIAARGKRVLPAWLVYVGFALAVAMIASGIGYVFDLPGIALAAAVSLPLLLIWITGSALTLRSAATPRG